MTESPQPSPEQEQPRKKGNLKGVVTGLVLLAGAGGVVYLYGQNFVYKQLSPLVSTQLTQILNRPVELGQVKAFSLNHLEFDKSKILPTPNDPDKITVPKIIVNFNLLQLLLERKLNLKVTAIHPEVSLQQALNGSWLPTPLNLPKPGAKELIKIEFQTLQIEDAAITLRARDTQKKLNPPVQVKIKNGQAEFSSKVDFNLTGVLANQGDLQIKGQVEPSNFLTTVNLIGSNLQAKEVSKLLPLPLTLEQGSLNANLNLNYNPQKTNPIEITGIAQLNQVDARLSQLPQPFKKAQGTLKFAGSKIILNGVSATFGSIKARAGGNLDLLKGYQLNAQTEPFSLKDALDTFKLKAPSLVIAGKVRAQIQLTGQLIKPNVALQVQSSQALQIDRLALANFQAKATLQDSYLNLQQWQARPSIGGLLQGNGQAILTPANKSNFALNFQAKQVPVDSLASIYSLNLPSKIGLVQAQGQIRGKAESANQLKITGQLQTILAGGKVNLDNIQYQSKSGQWQAQVKAKNIQLASFNLPIQQGEANADLQVAGVFKANANQALKVQGSASLALSQGTVNIPNLSAQDGQWKATITTNDLLIAGLVPALPRQIKGSINSNLSLSGSLKRPKETLEGQGTVAVALTDNSTIKLNQLSVSKGLWKTRIKAENIATAPFIPKIPTGQVNGDFNLAGTLDAPLETIQGNGSASLDSKQGQVRVNQINLLAGKFQAQANLQDIRLASLSPQLKGKLNGAVQLQGDLADLTPQAVQVQGDLSFSQGLSIIDRPLAARFSWQGKRLELQQVSAKGVDIKGWLDINPTKINQGIAALGEVSLNIIATHLNLQDLPVSLPPAAAKIKYQGWLDFAGGIRGTLQNPYIDGKIALERGIFGPLKLERLLEGTVKVSRDAGANLRLSGQRDNIAIALNSLYQLQAVDLQLKPVKLTARTQQSQLQLQVSYLSLAWLKDFLPYSPVPIPPNLADIAFGGDFSGNFKIDLQKKELISDNLQIVNPLIGPIQGQQFSGDISFINGDLTLSKASLKVNQTQYELSGVLQTKNNLAFQADAKIAQGQIQDILATLQIFEIGDFSRGLSAPVYGKAKSLFIQKPTKNTPLFNIGQPEAKVVNQLKRFSEIRTLLSLEQQKRKQSSLVPDLSKLKGNFDAQFRVSGSLKQPIDAQFNFSGQDWRWDTIAINEVLAKGQFKKGNLRVEPVRIQVGESILSFVGNLNDVSQTAELQLVKIPLSLVESFVKLPPTLSIGGVLNANLLISGGRNNPQARGELVVLDGNINQTPLESTQGTFSYNNSRLDFFASSVLAAGTPPLTLQGSFPYRFPFATKIPLSQQFAFNVNLRDNSLILLNVLTKEQLRWISGRGKVNLSVEGALNSTTQKVSQLQANGLVELQDGVISAQFIPDAPLTDINGKIALNFDRIDVKELTAKFSGSEVNVTGSLPLTSPTVPITSPLTVNFDGLAFNLKGLYQGGLQGQLVFSGTALNPRLGGLIDLFDGQVLLGNLVNEGKEVNPATQPSEVGAALEFKNLQLNLKKNIQLTQQPVLTFNATGGMTLNGSLDQPRPEGTIKLTNGLINLFAAQFRLGLGEENTATFTPSRGLDPYLNIRLFTSAAETVRNIVRADNLSSEIKDPFRGSTDGLQTIRIQAEVQGYASQLQQSIKLSSTPARTSGEIISLLGGGFIGGDPTVGLANIASSAFLGSFQESLRSALGITELRIFPTQLINSRDRTDASQIGIAAEVGIDLSPSLFFSAQQILNIDRPAQFGLRYRIDDSLVIRSSSNFSDDNRLVIEYQRRF